jgi:sialate O-acetylesterase
LHEHLEDWRAIAAAGHELGNHTCWHPCNSRPGWDWLPPAYRLEHYDQRRIRDEIVLANHLLHLVDGRADRSFAAAGGDTTLGHGGESFGDVLRELFPVMRNGLTPRAQAGPLPFAAPAVHADGRTADQIIAVAEQMRGRPDAWMITLMHGLGAGTHNDFIAVEEHRRLLDWIAEQRDWLEPLTMSEAARSRPRPPAGT